METTTTGFPCNDLVLPLITNGAREEILSGYMGKEEQKYLPH